TRRSSDLGSITYASPAPSSSTVPSSCVTRIRPERTTPTCRCWHLSVPATGFTHSDQLQPGSIAKRATVVPPTCTTSTRVLSGVRRSSGESKSRFSTPAISASVRRLPDYDSSPARSPAGAPFDRRLAPVSEAHLHPDEPQQSLRHRSLPARGATDHADQGYVLVQPGVTAARAYATPRPPPGLLQCAALTES